MTSVTADMKMITRSDYSTFTDVLYTVLTFYRQCSQTRSQQDESYFRISEQNVMSGAFYLLTVPASAIEQIFFPSY
jgi:hypothetical protein